MGPMDPRMKQEMIEMGLDFAKVPKGITGRRADRLRCKIARYKEPHVNPNAQDRHERQATGMSARQQRKVRVAARRRAGAI